MKRIYAMGILVSMACVACVASMSGESDADTETASASVDQNLTPRRSRRTNDGVRVILGSDFNSAENSFLQPEDPALTGGGIDQTLEHGDVLSGDDHSDVIFGGLGVDLLFGNGGNDVLVGGTEAGAKPNADRAFGGSGDDTFVWQPGDGSDLFEGGTGNHDTVMFGIIAGDDNGEPEFSLDDDVDVQGAGGFEIPFLDPVTRLPIVDVPNLPGFCEVIDRSTPDAADQLTALGLTHLVRFVSGPARDSFERGEQTIDNGVRVTLHLRNVEFVACANRTGGQIEVLDLRVSPPRPAKVSDLAFRAQQILRKDFGP